MKTILFAITLFSCFSFLMQTSIRKVKLPRPICSSMEDEIAPFVSINGKHLIYSLKPNMSSWTVQYSEKKRGKWSRPIDVDPLNKSPKLNYLGGYCLNTEGDEIYYTSKKYGGIGGYDIWKIKKKKDNTWGDPENLGKPLNSTSNDANPSLSTDGKTIYFMRCKSLEENSSECCKIYSSTRKGSTWSTPHEIHLHDKIDCHSTPRISADGKHLYFAGKPSSETNLDIYVSKQNAHGKWDKPERIDELSTPNDDQFISVNIYSNQVYMAEKDENSWDLFVAELPEKHRSSQMQNLILRLKSIEDSSTINKATIKIYNKEKNNIIAFEKPNSKGVLNSYLPPQKVYYTIENKTGWSTIDTINIEAHPKLKSTKKEIYLSKNIATGDTLFYPWTNDHSYQKRLATIISKNIELNNMSNYKIGFVGTDSTLFKKNHALLQKIDHKHNNCSTIDSVLNTNSNSFFITKN